MDPQACWNRFCDACEADDREDAIDALDDLLSWDGFLPDNVPTFKALAVLAYWIELSDIHKDE